MGIIRKIKVKNPQLNAMQAAGPDGRLSVSVSQSAELIAIEIADSQKPQFSDTKPGT